MHGWYPCLAMDGTPVWPWMAPLSGPWMVPLSDHEWYPCVWPWMVPLSGHGWYPLTLGGSQWLTKDGTTSWYPGPSFWLRFPDPVVYSPSNGSAPATERSLTCRALCWRRGRLSPASLLETLDYEAMRRRVRNDGTDITWWMVRLTKGFNRKVFWVCSGMQSSFICLLFLPCPPWCTQMVCNL